MKLTKIDEVTFEQFQSLFNYAGASNPNELKGKIGNLRNEAGQDIHFKSMYKNIFNLYIGNHTTLEMDVAEQLWAVYLVNKFQYYKQWVGYIGSLEDKENKKVHKDLWNMVLEFIYEVKDIKDYNDEEGWPIFIDDFVEYVKSGK